MTTTTTQPDQPGPATEAHGVAEARSLFDGEILRHALVDSVKKLNPALALGGSLAAKNVVPESLGTFRTDNGMFVGLTIGVIIIIGGLTFFPALALGPIVEQLSHGMFF